MEKPELTLETIATIRLPMHHLRSIIHAIRLAKELDTLYDGDDANVKFDSPDDLVNELWDNHVVRVGTSTIEFVESISETIMDHNH